jgi:hypothetical protein
MYRKIERQERILSIDEHQYSLSPKWLDFAVACNKKTILDFRLSPCFLLGNYTASGRRVINQKKAYKKIVIWKTLLTLHVIIFLAESKFKDNELRISEFNVMWI